MDGIRAEAAALDSGVILNEIATLRGIRAGFVSPQRFSMMLLGLFGGVAMALAGAGIYGVMSYSVGQRTQEIGVRRALGAESAELRAMVMWQGFRLVLVGLFAGLAGTIALTRVLESQLWGVTATDPLTIGLVAVLLTLVALVAFYVPLRRATRVDPVVALRYE